MLVAVIGVGTELTSGQIINRNSAWISKNLKDLGVPTSCHLVVPDDRALILDALRFCAERSDTLFVTGGLGPTTDDFTRELISEWSQLPLEFDQASWDHVNHRLSSRGIQVRESQRQQCLFPKGAKVLTNPEGTANAFQMRVFNKDVFVLPGPPSEIAAVWKGEISDFLRDKTKDIDQYITYSWDTMGLGESDVAHIAENALAGIEIEKGYRVHLPYVEVKISFLASEKEKLAPAISRLNEALKHITITRDGDDVPTLIANKLTGVPKLHIVDTLSGQVLLNRLVPALRSFMSEKAWSFSSTNNFHADPQSVKLVLKAWDATSAIAEIHYKGGSFKTIFEAPFMISKMTERKALYFAERAMIFWLQKLEDMI
ncbi:competence/damage-inducible protein A [Bdellovibrio sp. HCB337]|uniref:competence/damage-inducible protein A n=1 Tax=Bdellovibrio sp. HCB337 TaxID=3394358 RepID=UPI0039A575B5